jgi:hypothetical protein
MVEEAVLEFAKNICAGGEMADNDEVVPAASQRRRRQPKHDGPFFASLYEMEQSNICSESVEKGIRAIWPRWKEFHAGRDGAAADPWVPGLGLQLYSSRVDINNAEDYDRAAVDGFLAYLNNIQVGPTVMTKAKTFLNHHLKCEHYWRLRNAGAYPSLCQIQVGKGKSVQQSVKSANARAASQCLDRCEDIQAGLEQLMTNDQLREMSLLALMPKPGGEVEKLELMNRIYFVCHYHTLNATTRRGEELYCQRLVQRSTTHLPEIGPFGCSASQLITNKSKHNQNGWLEQTTMLPHMDPTRDAPAWHGIMWLWRLLIEKESFPNFLGKSEEDYKALFQVWSYPSVTDPKVHIDSSKFGQNFTAFFHDAGVVCAKKTHQPRFQSIQEMDRMGIPESLQLRMTGHKGKEATVHQKSYAHNPPTQCIIQRAGGDPGDRRNFYPAHFHPTPEEKDWCNELVRRLVPEIVQHHATICNQYESTVSLSVRLAERLYTLKGLLSSMLYEIEHAILMLATPLVDPDTFQLVGSRSIWQLYHNEALAALLNMSPFRSETFAKLESSVLLKMKDRASFSSALTPQAKCALEQMMVQHVARPMAEMFLQTRTLMKQQEQQHQQQMQMMQSGSTTRLVTPDKLSRKVFDRLSDTEESEEYSASDVLADGFTPRKRRVPLRQPEAISQVWKSRDAGGSLEPHDQLLLLCDKNCVTLADYWNTYKTEWKPLEVSTGGEWRRDLPGSRARSAWWTQRVGMFLVIEHYMEADKLTEEMAVDKANKIFENVKVAKNGKRPIKDINKAYKQEMERLKINRKGRPSTAGSKKKRRRWAVTNDDDGVDDFAAAFSNLNDSQQAFFDQAQEEAVAARNAAEKARIERDKAKQREKQQSQWEYTNRHNRNVGPAPPNYGMQHPLPFRPYQNQPQVPLPPGHHYPTLP